MAAPTPKEFHARLKQRLQQTREELHWTQDQMATALGVNLDTYKKWELRGRFPIHFIEKLSLVTHRPIDYWIAGRNVIQFARRERRE